MKSIFYLLLLSSTASAQCFIETDTLTPAGCGLANGSIDIEVQNAQLPIVYSWSNGVVVEDLVNVPSGTYTLTATDANGCVATTSIALSESSGVTVVVNGGNNVTCPGGNDGAVDIDIAVGIAPCASATVAINEVMYRAPSNNGEDPNAGEMIELIAPAGTDLSCYVLTDGDWTITLPLGSIVPADGLFTIGNDNVYGTGTFDLDAENCTCFTEGLQGGSLLIFTDGGEYLALFDDQGDFLQGLRYGSPSPNNLPPNGSMTSSSGRIYTRGLAGCPDFVDIPSGGYAMHPGGAGVGTSLIRDPDGTGAWTTQTGGSINDCNVQIPVTYTVLWSNGDTLEDLDSLTAGVYIVTVTDGAGCVDTETVSIQEPAAITAIISTVPANCEAANGNIDCTPQGGTPDYTYIWSNGATTPDNPDIYSGNYLVTITDARGCTATQTVIVPNVSGLAATAIAQDALCHGIPSGSIAIDILSGAAPYQYQWSDGSSDSLNAPIVAGIYTATITDANGCITTIFSQITEPAAVSIQLDSLQNETCDDSNNGLLRVSAQGGVGGFGFNWNNGDTTAQIVSLNEGLYQLSVTDANGCVWRDSFAITAPDPLLLQLLTQNDTIGCDAIADAAVFAEVSGGVGGYGFNWWDGAGTATRTDLGAGIYALTVTDVNGCAVSDSARIYALIPAQVTASIGMGGNTFDTLLIGSTTLLFATPPADTFDYAWTIQPATGISIVDSSSISTEVTVLELGNYTCIVRVVSPDGCTASDTAYLTVIRDLLGMPTAFTPNGDGQNDRFRPLLLDPYFIVNFEIYNRFGDKVYDDPALSDGGWDGRLGGAEQARDQYFYVLRYRLPGDGEERVLRGWFMLLR